jgi:hypothetical protein
MKSLLIVAILTFLRLGIPTAVLLIAGELIQRHGTIASQTGGTR